MAEIREYQLSPTNLIPNSPRPLLHYPGILLSSKCMQTAAYDAFSSNGWQVQWIFRYGRTQMSHYHSETHECMAVLSGIATIRFGVADTLADEKGGNFGPGKEDGGVELQARAGDVFVIPAGVAHKTFDPHPSAEFMLLTSGDGHHISDPDARSSLESLELSGFTMIGAYPVGAVWDFAVGGQNTGNYEKVWTVAKPENDPILGKANDGLCGRWD